MLLAADYPFLNILWTMIIFFAWMAWFWMAISVFSDVFRRHDIGGWGKAGWCVVVILLPFLGVLIYLIGNAQGMAERNMERVKDQKAQMDAYVRDVAGGGSASEIANAKQLLDSGAITQEEFNMLKQKALAT